MRLKRDYLPILYAGADIISDNGEVHVLKKEGNVEDIENELKMLLIPFGQVKVVTL